MQKNKKLTGLLAYLGVMIILISPLFCFAQTDHPADSVGKLSKVAVPGTSVSMTLPNVFIYDPAQSSYLYAGAAASVAVKELKGTSYTSLLKGMTKKNIESQGMKLIESRDLQTSAGQKGIMFIAGFSAQSKDGDKKFDYERIIYISGNGAGSVWITMNYPLITKSLLSEMLNRCLLTVEFE